MARSNATDSTLTTETAHCESELVRRIASASMLWRAWETVRQRDLSDGLSSLGVVAFEQTVEETIAATSTALVEGTYAPQPLTQVTIPKSSGGSRALAIPTIRDRIVERAIHDALVDTIDATFTPLSFAYRPGLGVDDAVRALARERDHGHRLFVRADFKECFDSLDRERLLRYLSTTVRDDAVVRLVRRLLARPVRIGRRLRPTSRGVPQGSPLSPLLCNLYLDQFDRGMARRGWRALRYADDMAVPVDSAAEADSATSAVTAEARAIGLELNAEKTRTLAISDGFEFLGVTIGESLPPCAALRRRPATKTIYVAEQGSRVTVRQGRAEVWKAGETLLAVPVGHVGQLVLFGHVDLSASARSHALRSGVEVHFLSRRGSYQGRLEGTRPAGAELRRRQYAFADDPARAAAIVRTIVDGKLANLRAMLSRHLRRSAATSIAQAVDGLERIRRRLAGVETIAVLRGHEGAGSRLYFQSIGKLLDDDLGFKGRNRRPATDPVNSALSFGYSILAATADGAVRAAGLDPHVGFLHAVDRDRSSLALDLMEEFRPLCVDTVVVECFRRGVLRPADFYREEPSGRCLFRDDARRRFLSAYEERQLTLFAHTPSGQRTTYRRAIFLQARQIAACILGAQPGYRPVRWR